MGHFQTTRIAFVVGIIATGAVLYGTAPSLAEPPANLPQLKEIADAYKANKSRFTSGKCRFSYSIYSADDEASALKGQRSDREAPRSMEYTLYFLDDMLSVAPDAYRTALKIPPLNEDAEVSPVNVVQKGAFAIDYDSGSAIVYSPANPRVNIRYHPFNLATDASGVDPASSVEYAIAHDFEDMELVVEKGVERDGSKYVLLKTSSAANSHDIQVYLDPSRGYLPFITEHFNKPWAKLAFRMILLDVREQDGAFFPLHAMMISYRRPPNESPYVGVREMKVLELDLDYKPTNEDLTIFFPRGTQYSDGVNPKTAKTVFGNSPTDLAPVSVHDIEWIHDFLQKLAVARE